jgi:hypothetical protein
MNLWVRLSQLPAFGRDRRGAQKLTEAYRNVFSGHGSINDAQMVLADLANYSGFYRVTGPDVDGPSRAFADGMRLTYGRILRFLAMTDQELQDLQEAARQEALADLAATEGT